MEFLESITFLFITEKVRPYNPCYSMIEMEKVKTVESCKSLFIDKKNDSKYFICLYTINTLHTILSTVYKRHTTYTLIVQVMT